MAPFSNVCAAAPSLEFDNKFRDLISLHVGASLKIPVRVSGIPVPRVTWATEEAPLCTGGRITIHTTDDATTLTVKKVTKDEDGLITLTADNPVGEAKAKFDVEVLGKHLVGRDDSFHMLIYTIVYQFKSSYTGAYVILH